MFRILNIKQFSRQEVLFKKRSFVRFRTKDRPFPKNSFGKTRI